MMTGRGGGNKVTHLRVIKRNRAFALNIYTYILPTTVHIHTEIREFIA